MLTKAWRAHENGYQTPAVPPHTETPACYSLYFKPFCLSVSPVHPGCWEPGTCQQHAPPRKSEDIFLQPPSPLHRFCLWHDFGSLLLSHYNSPLHSSFLMKGMSHCRAGVAPHEGGVQQPPPSTAISLPAHASTASSFAM